MINNAGGLIAGNTAVDAAALETMQDTLEAMEIGPLFALFLQCMVVQFTIKALSVVIFVIVYGRMIEIYLMTSMQYSLFIVFPSEYFSGRCEIFCLYSRFDCRWFFARKSAKIGGR